MSKQDPKKEGQIAKINGLTLQDCPYPDHSTSRKKWIRGYSIQNRLVCPECGWECIRINNNVVMGYQSFYCVFCQFSAIEGTNDWFKVIERGREGSE